jgi:excisionase family DNA binding protein
MNEHERLLTFSDIAARFQVTPTTVRRWASRGAIPTVRVQGVVRVESSAVDSLLRRAREPLTPRPQPLDPNELGWK